MLTSLILNNFMVFQEASADFDAGLIVLTGETGAGKSTILAALEIILGMKRAETDFIRTGAPEAQLKACFEFTDYPQLEALCHEYDIPYDGLLIIRRHIRKDRPNRSYINDIPVTSQILSKIGALCAEICGQFEDRDMLSYAGFRKLLDDYIPQKHFISDVAEKYTQLQSLQTSLAEQKQLLASTLREQDYLRHVLTELEQLNPQKDEETSLAQKRAEIMAVEKNMSTLLASEQMLMQDNHLEKILLEVIKSLSQLEKDFPETLPDITTFLNEALDRLSLGGQLLSDFNRALNYDPQELAHTEERLFALRAAARKHHISVDDLCDLYTEYQEKLAHIDHGEATLLQLEKDIQIATEAFTVAALALREQREKIIPKLTDIISSHLKDLNLSAARFRIRMEETLAHRGGLDQIIFELSTGPSIPYGAVHKIASGGEMSRFMLALKAAGTSENKNRILIFDEIDRGVGGATAEAVGCKLKSLSEYSTQLIVITHSPQVAAKGKLHFHILKKHSNNVTSSYLSSLTGDNRREEIARMLSGAKVTDQARAAADQLMYF
ncbi:MAG: DNA repair protein RecN [Pseudomonadota bacterium]